MRVIIQKEEEEILSILKRDYEIKVEMNKKDETRKKFVEWATGGVNYMPEPK